MYGKLRHERAVAKKQRRETRQKAEAAALEAGEEPAPRQIPKTIENQRVRDATHIDDLNDVDVVEQDAEDEFASYFSQATSPKIIITTSRKPSGDMFKFFGEFVHGDPERVLLRAKELSGQRDREAWHGERVHGCVGV